MYITLELSDSTYLPCIHRFLEHTDPDTELSYILLYYIEDESFVTPYFGLAWVLVREIVKEIIDMTGYVSVSIFNATILGGNNES